MRKGFWLRFACPAVKLRLKPMWVRELLTCDPQKIMVAWKSARIERHFAESDQTEARMQMQLVVISYDRLTWLFLVAVQPATRPVYVAPYPKACTCRIVTRRGFTCRSI
jgi:hypothetical protein